MGKNLFIGKILTPYGNKGYLKVLPSPVFKEDFFEKNVVWVFVFGDYRRFVLEDFVVKKDFIAVKFKNFDCSEDVSFLKEKEIFVRGEDFAGMDDDLFLLSDLKNLKVVKNNRFFGRVRDIINLKQNDVLALERFDGEEVLIPFTSEFVEEVNLKEAILKLKDDIEY